MATLVERRNPINLLQRSFWNDLFDRDAGSPTLFRDGEMLPAINIRENESEFEVDFAVPGYKKSDFNISVENGMLIVKAEIKDQKEEKHNGYARREFSYQSFERSFSLPENVNQEKISGNYENGILRIMVPKLAKEFTSEKKKVISIL
jgi:HSP20 family protein